MPGSDSPRADAVELDNYDLAILSALAEDAELSTIELAKIVHLSRTAVARRITNLRETGVLGPMRANIQFEKLGFAIRGLVEVSAPNQDSFRVRDELLARPEVLNVSVVLGEHLMIVEVIARDTRHLHQFLTWLNDFGCSETNVLLQHIRSDMTLRDRLQKIEEMRANVDPRLTDVSSAD